MTHDYLPRKKREGNWSRNTSRNCFWDHYLGGTGQVLANVVTSLVTIPEVFAKVNSASRFYSWEFRRHTHHKNSQNGEKR